MKFVIINGSPRRKNTWSAVKHAKNNLDGEFEEIHLMKEKIPVCNGCYKCFEEGEEKCPHFDKINPIMEKINDAEGIIIASPVYAMNVSALLKNFIDHVAYLYHRPRFFTKKAMVIVTTAGAGQKDVANYIDETLRHWGVNKVYKIAIACGGKDNLETKEIDSVSQKFANDVKSNKLHSPTFKDIVFFDVWKAMAVSEVPIPADEKYWKETGFVNCDFSPEVKLNPVKKVFSKIMFAILKKVIK